MENTNIINLENKYYLKVIDGKTNMKAEAINIEELKLTKVFKKKKILLKIDFDNININNYKKVLKRLLRVRKYIRKTKIGLEEENKTLLGYVLNYDENKQNQKDFIHAVNAIFYNTKYERYNYIYDTVCDYLDSYFYGKNLCDFKDNKCGEKRNTSSVIGCCRHYKIKLIGPLSKFVPCEYLDKKDYTCSARCIACKLFTCDYLEKKGVKFKIKDILLLNVFFNPLQKYFIKYMVYTPKDKIIKRLMLLGN